MSVCGKDKGTNPTNINLQISCSSMKTLRVFCLVGFSFFFYSLEKVISVLIKSKSTINRGLSKFLHYRQLITGDADKELLL